MGRCIFMSSGPTLLIIKDFMIANTPVPTIAAPPPKLLDQVRAKVRLKHYSIRTETQYVHWVKRFIVFHGKRHPKEMATAMLTASQQSLLQRCL